MVDKIFLQVLNMSFTASIVISIVLIVRLLLRKAPKGFSYALWSVVLFRLICPFSFESIFSLLPTKANPISQDIVYMPIPEIDTGIMAMNHSINVILPAATPQASANPLQIWMFIGSQLWLLGIAALLGYSLVTLLRLKKRLQDATPYQDNIFTSSKIDTAFVMGIFHPKIYLPSHLSDTEQTYILLHEQTHIRRLDHIVKLISFLVLSIHWFNPLAWIAFFLSGKDIEMSCDEAVIKQLGNDVKKDYSTSLLTLATGRRIVGGTPLAFGEGDTKGRIKNVLDYKKPAFWLVVVGIIAVAFVLIGFTTNPKEGPDGLKGTIPSEQNGVQGMYPTEDLWDARTKYVGDNSAVGTLIGLLPVPIDLNYDHFALQTRAQPYHVEIVYSVSTQKLAAYDKENASLADSLKTNALLLMALIENVDEIQATLTDGSRKVSFTYDREWANQTINGDVRDYAKSPEKLQKLIDSIGSGTTNETVAAVYSIAKLGKNNEVLSEFSSDTQKLADAMIMDAFMKSAAWEGVDITTLEECYRIRQILPETNEIHDYYAYLLEDGKAVLQMNRNGMYTSLSKELYAQLVSSFESAEGMFFWVKPDEPPQVIGDTAAVVWLKSFMEADTPDDSRITDYKITNVTVIAGNPKQGVKWEDMAYQYVVRLTYNITTAAEQYSAPSDGISGKGTFQNLFRELGVKVKSVDGGGYQIVSVGTGGAEQEFD
ncbi:DUF4825 domain-containing protein [Anoxybacterium hadale]|uniref:DUF4825 domain-containing protein n=1 Tax=Anoxybacterium hadale TaxID=3408580 RepID=A0ACD1AFM7_9FIRM|nr:DUF4825 domain-containing protein [Clostridiales bacterium]